MIDHTVYLVSGASRGIGLGIVTSLAQRKNVTIYAGCRDTSEPGEGLATLASEHADKLRLVRLNSAEPSDARNVSNLIQYGSGKLDVVVANAGICTHFGPLLNTPVESFQEHFEINTMGPLVLFQGVGPLLLKSAAPKFIVISSGAASISEHLSIPASPYGVSKAGANYLVAKMHIEHPELTATAYAPGWVATDLTKDVAGSSDLVAGILTGMTPTPVAESMKALLLHVDSATRAKHGGRFWDWNQEERKF